MTILVSQRYVDPEYRMVFGMKPKGLGYQEMYCDNLAP